ncbi:hypothetical protein EGT74_19420 [Chitinophaga lutea]|uniref:Uncharacterized protein n=1 Tax=Chitinophaga lutea TaxID=2488634 RepID=A0A3N4PR06_9BACT|nr:hypothetical protein EGT74_19420 [Chitinophaga lutea]
MGATTGPGAITTRGATVIRTGGAATITLGTGGLTTTHWALTVPVKLPDRKIREMNTFCMSIFFLRRSGRKESRAPQMKGTFSGMKRHGYRRLQPGHGRFMGRIVRFIPAIPYLTGLFDIFVT